MDTKIIRKEINDIEEELIKIRRDFHAHPEKGFEEYRTSKIVAEWLKNCGIQTKTGVVGTGVVGLIEGKCPGPTIGIRVDIDGLSGPDKKEVEYASTVPGVSHACGHDVHTTIGMGAAKVISRLKDQFNGNVKLIFQASEELPKKVEGQVFDVYTEYPVGKRGGDLAIEEGVLEGPKVDRLLGIHCWPSLEAGKIGYQYGPAMAGTGNFHIAVLGKGGHAATPHKTVDPMPVTAEVIMALQTVISRKVDPTYPLVLTIGTIKGGTRRSVITDRIDLTGTVRGFDTDVLGKEVPMHMESLIKGICEGNGGSYIFEYGVDEPPVVNDDTVVRDTAISLKRVLGDNAVELKDAPMTAEDFSFMARVVPSIYMKLGTCNGSENTCYPLHNPKFDVDESCIACGVTGIVHTVFDFLEQNQIDK
jgi:amidohydrolase